MLKGFHLLLVEYVFPFPVLLSFRERNDIKKPLQMFSNSLFRNFNVGLVKERHLAVQIYDGSKYIPVQCCM